MRFKTFAAMFAIMTVAAPITEAVDVVTWGTATGITGDSDVSTNGTLIYAYNLGASGVTSTTVNGVTFDAWTIPQVGKTTTFNQVTFTETDAGRLHSYNTLGSIQSPFSGLSSVYQALLSTAGTSTNPNTINLTLGGLTAGKSYEFQWWSNNSSLQANPSFGETYLNTTSTAGNSVLLQANPTGVLGNLGQYVIGTFTASGTSQVISYNGTSPSRALINAIQLRDITNVPEPSTYALAAIASGVMAAVARRRRAKPVK